MKKQIKEKQLTVAIIGANGQLGSDLVKVFGDSALPLTRKDIDVTSQDSCYNAIKELRPSAVINTAAYHNVENCELNGDTAFLVNSTGAKHVANACFNYGVINCYISTDYVFGGNRGNYTENDSTRPLNTYGQSKLNGEITTMVNTPRHYIFRVSSLFGVAESSCKGPNFVEKMIAQKDKDEIVVDDVITMSPTYTVHAASAIKDALENRIPFETYHVCNTGSTTWYKFARKIFAISGISAKLTPSYEMKHEYKIPINSCMSNAKIAGCGVKMYPWLGGLKEYLVEKGYV